MKILCLLMSMLALPLVATMARSEDRTNSIGMRLVRIEPGTFAMGDSQRGDFDERPVHQVTISRPFWMSATEVTNAQYERFDPRHKALRGKRGFSKGNDEAVVFVSWHDAVAFCQWLSKQEGQAYRLPTEAEWEYACRAGTTTAFWTGQELPKEFLNNPRISWYPSARSKPEDVVSLEVARTPANPWGLFDMHGNVEEWCADWYGPYVPQSETDPVGRASGDFRVSRGGSHSTTPTYLRSANRSGTLPEDRSWVIGFRVVQAPMPSTQPLPAAQPPSVQQNVVQAIPPEVTRGPDPNRPYFRGPRPYVRIAPGSNGPLFSEHNHDPAIVECPNGDLLAIWYTCEEEVGRELTIAASRLRRGADQWEPACPFWGAPDRNNHAPALWADGKGKIYHFNGLGVAATWGALATVLRVSSDSGATWSKARLIMPEHAQRHMPVESVLETREGAWIVPCDAVTSGQGGTAVLVSRDQGRTWTDPGEGKPTPQFAAGQTGAWIAGIHAAVAQLADGRLLALGRGNAIDGHMPMSLSADQGQTWTYSASPFPPVRSGQRLVLLRLREGPLLVCSFGKDVPINDVSGARRNVSGLFAALTLDEGRTWTIQRPVSDDGPPRRVEAMDRNTFTMSRSSAEPAGYLSICQAQDGVIHLISSKNHYAFNLAWLNARPPADLPVPTSRDAGGKRAAK